MQNHKTSKESLQRTNSRRRHARTVQLLQTISPAPPGHHGSPRPPLAANRTRPRWAYGSFTFSTAVGVGSRFKGGASLKPRKAPWKRRERGGRHFSRPDKSKPTPGRLGVPVGLAAHGQAANPLDSTPPTYRFVSLVYRLLYRRTARSTAKNPQKTLCFEKH